MPRYLFSLSRFKVVEDILEIPVQALSLNEAKQKLDALQESDDYDESLYITEDSPITHESQPFTRDGLPSIID